MKDKIKNVLAFYQQQYYIINEKPKQNEYSYQMII